MKTVVSVSIDLAREIYERLVSQGLSKTEEVLEKIKRAKAGLLNFQVFKFKNLFQKFS